jgi:hypothetical protein
MMMTTKMQMTMIQWKTELMLRVMKHNILVCNRISCFIFCAAASRSIYESDLDVDGSPSALFLVRKWRAQNLENDDRIAWQERVFNTEEYFKARLADGDVTNQEAESLNWRIKNARTEWVSIAQQFMYTNVRNNFPRCRTNAGHIVYATRVSTRRSYQVYCYASIRRSSKLEIRRPSVLAVLWH